jgi:hypothetical protein
MNLCALEAGEVCSVALGTPPALSTSGVQTFSVPPLRAPQIGSCAVAHTGVVSDTQVMIALQAVAQ